MGMARLKILIESAVTQEMLDWYERRTAKHIRLVQKWAGRIAEFDGAFSDLPGVAAVHDRLKYDEPERTPYIWITWQYRCKELGRPFACPVGMRELMNDATQHHVLSNPHHPEFWAPVSPGLRDRENRDRVSDLVDATKMSRLALMEMLSDWCAMSEEKGSDVRDWMDKNIGVRWKFTNDQVREMERVVGGLGL